MDCTRILTPAVHITHEGKGSACMTSRLGGITVDFYAQKVEAREGLSLVAMGGNISDKVFWRRIIASLDAEGAPNPFPSSMVHSYPPLPHPGPR